MTRRGGESSQQAVTVLGPISADKLEIVLPHEHVTIDNRFNTQPRLDIDEKAPLTVRDVPGIRAWPRAKSDNLVLDRDELVVSDLIEFRDLGGGTIVEMTTSGNGRDLTRLRDVSRASGVAIVATTGCYVGASHIDKVAKSTLDELTKLFVEELTEGDIRCGAIGEIGLSRQPTKQEWKGLEAALRASDETGAPVWVHITTLQPLENLLDWLAERQESTEKIVICHMDHDLRDLALHRRVLEMGATVEFDLFGLPAWTGGPFLHAPTDTQRMQALIELASGGWSNQLLMSHDVCQKIQLPEYGGFGYTHILKNVRAQFERLGGPGGLFEQITIDNPRRLLAWEAS